MPLRSTVLFAACFFLFCNPAHHYANSQGPAEEETKTVLDACCYDVADCYEASTACSQYNKLACDGSTA